MDNGVVFWQDEFDVGCSRRELRHGGVVVGYYHDVVPFRHRNAFINGVSGLPSVPSVLRGLNCLAQMNMDVDNMVIMAAAQKYIGDKTRSMFKFDDEFMLRQIDWAKSQPSGYWVEKRYEWLSRLDRKTIMQIVQKNGCDVKKKKLIDAVRAGIEALTFDGVFLTTKAIAEVIDENYDRVASAIGLFRDEIDKYNKVNFGTTNYKEFVKKENVSNIRRVVLELGVKNKRKVAAMTNTHYNTVGNLWAESFGV
jgi:hypothetical protein